MTEGYKTSEGIGTAVATLLSGTYGLSSDSVVVQAVAVGGICFLFGMYALSRGLRKGGKSA